MLADMVLYGAMAQNRSNIVPALHIGIIWRFRNGRRRLTIELTGARFSASGLNEGLDMDDGQVIVLENANGVQIREDRKFSGHYGAANATCECGEELIVAPMLFHANHKKGDPVMICGDHGVHGYRFSTLELGRQQKGSANKMTPNK